MTCLTVPAPFTGMSCFAKKKQIITTERRNASPAACYFKSLEKWNAGWTEDFDVRYLPLCIAMTHRIGYGGCTSWDWAGEAMVEGLMVAHDLSCLRPANLSSTEGSHGRTALLVPSVLASKGETGSDPVGSGYPLLALELQPLPSRGQHSKERKSCPD